MNRVDWFSTGWIFTFLSVVTADIHSCGGFIRSPVPIDYSKIQIKLLTPEGHMKHEEECNQQNGYYMIPIYNKGSYSLRVSAPAGWYFEPEVFEVHLDGVNDPCTKGEDINFSLTGFAVDGKVDGVIASAGRVGLTLLQNERVVQQTTTTDEGLYHFSALPGTYKVATVEDSNVCVEVAQRSIEVVSSPVTVESLKISGYKVTIYARNKGAPLAGVNFELQSKQQLKLPKCKTSTAGSTCDLGETGIDGSIIVPCMPNGELSIRPQFARNNVLFNFNPVSSNVDVSTNKKLTFEISGFNLNGRVTVGGVPFAGAAINVNGRQLGVTDGNGQYTIENAQEGNIEITVTADHIKFNALSRKLTLPDVALPDITEKEFEVCGSVEMTEKSDVTLILSSTSGSAHTVRPTTDGSFCKYAAPGKYSLSVADEQSALTPRVLEVTVDKPITGLRFTYFKTDAEARVSCIGACDQLTLTLLLGSIVVSTQRGTDVFTFNDIGPGKYTVRLSDDGNSCWQEMELPLEIARQQPKPVQFVQNGFVANVKLSHGATLTWTHAEKKQIRGELNAVAGLNSICVPVQGRYNVQLTSCFKFDQQTFGIHVPSSSVSSANAVSASLSGVIRSSANADFTVLVKSSAGERIVPAPKGSFSFDELLTTTSNVVLTPQSDAFLFEPSSFSFPFMGECASNMVSFAAERGIYVEGNISPVVAGATITAAVKRDKNIKLNAVTDASGRYKVGPVRQSDELTIEAQLDGFSFTKKAGSVVDFASVKLSKLTVAVVDSTTGERLTDVLLSLVGAQQYRSNTLIGKDGQTHFIALAPGEYFVRPILQEYKFEPSTTTITIKEGLHEQVQLSGKRVSYSAFGRVRELSGKGIEGVVIEAISESCEQHQSEASSISDGSFRVRGLKPNCEYRVAATKLANDSHSPHCTPSQFTVRMTAEDVKGLEMVVAPIERGTDVAVEIEFGASMVAQSFRVSVHHKEGSVVSQAVVHSPVTVFYVNNLDRDGSEYGVRVEPDRPAQAFIAKTVFFTADAPVRVVRVPITTSRRASDVEISVGSLLALPFFAIVALVFFNQNRAQEIFQALLSQVRSSSPATSRRKKAN